MCLEIWLVLLLAVRMYMHNNMYMYMYMYTCMHQCRRPPDLGAHAPGVGPRGE